VPEAAHECGPHANRESKLETLNWGCSRKERKKKVEKKWVRANGKKLTPGSHGGPFGPVTKGNSETPTRATKTRHENYGSRTREGQELWTALKPDSRRRKDAKRVSRRSV